MYFGLNHPSSVGPYPGYITRVGLKKVEFRFHAFSSQLMVRYIFVSCRFITEALFVV